MTRNHDADPLTSAQQAAAGSEAAARQEIDLLLGAAGWTRCDASNGNIHAARGVAIREFPLPGHGFADYLLYVDGKAAGVIEAKKQGSTLSGVEIQSDKYTQGLPTGLPRWRNPLPFAYQSKGVDKSAGQLIWSRKARPKGGCTRMCRRQTHFTNGLDPQPRARSTFAFHRREALAEWLDSARHQVREAPADYHERGKTYLARLRHMPPLRTECPWPAQIKAINNLEKSLRENRPRALIQMGERRPFVRWTNAASRTPDHGWAGWTRHQDLLAGVADTRGRLWTPSGE
jgi:type I restriction enzyme R subunit